MKAHPSCWASWHNQYIQPVHNQAEGLFRFSSLFLFPCLPYHCLPAHKPLGLTMAPWAFPCTRSPLLIVFRTVLCKVYVEVQYSVQMPFFPHSILPPFCERRSCSRNLILFLNLHQFFPVVVTWPSTELLPIYTSACEMTIGQSTSLLDFWKEWPCWGIPEAKNVISVGKASFTPVCTGRIEFTRRSKNHYLITSAQGACLSQLRNSFES